MSEIGGGPTSVGFEAFRFSSQVAFHDADGAVTYEQARERVYALARVLARFGLGPGDVAAFVAHASTWSFLLQYAINHLGAAHLEVPSRLPTAYQAAVIREAGARLLIYDPAVDAEAFIDLLALDAQSQLLTLGPALSGRGQDVLALANSASPTSFPGRRQPAQVISLDLSGATTGVPKAAERRFQHSCEWQLPFQHDVPARLLKIGRISNIGRSLAHDILSAGGTVHSMRTFDAVQVIAVMQEHRITHAFLLPQQLRLLLDCPEVREADLSSLQCVMTSTTFAPPALLEKAIERLGAIVHYAYGLAEAGVISELRPADYANSGQHRLGTCGRSSPGAEICVRADDGTLAPPGQWGMIWARTPWMMNGYWRRPDLTQRAMRDGWLCTGDIGSLDAEGYLTVLGRATDAVHTGATTIHPREVEDSLRSHPAVYDAAAYGVPESDGTARIDACVVLQPDAAVVAQELRDWVSSDLTAAYAPTRVLFLPEIPVTHANKPDRNYLRKLSTTD